MADPGFLRGCQPKEGANLLFGIIFAESCMKMTKIGPEGGGGGRSTQWRIQDFAQGGAPTPKIAIIFQIFAKNCMKMKEFGPLGGASLAPPLDPPMVRVSHAPLDPSLVSCLFTAHQEKHNSPMVSYPTPLQFHISSGSFRQRSCQSIGLRAHQRTIEEITQFIKAICKYCVCTSIPLTCSCLLQR